MAPDRPPLVMTIPSHPAHLARARTFIVDACRSGGFDNDTARAFALAVHEALHNVIRHAHFQQEHVPLVIHCYPCVDRIEVHVLDEGEPFDVTAVPHLDPGEVRLGGRGVFLMRTLTDELSCRPRDGRGNVLRLVKHHGSKRCPGNGDGHPA